MARVRTDEVIAALYRASQIDPGNPQIGRVNSQHARVAITTRGTAEITTDLDPRSLSDGVIVYFNPYQGAYSMMDYSSMDAAVNDTKLHSRLENFLTNIKGSEGVIRTDTLGYLIGTDEMGIKTPMR